MEHKASHSTSPSKHKKPSHSGPTPAHDTTSATTYTLIPEPDQGLSAIYSLLSSAQKAIDMTMYELTDVTVTDSLAKSAAGGVTVRVILDQNSEKTSNTPVYNSLTSNGVCVHWVNPAYAVTH